MAQKEDIKVVLRYLRRKRGVCRQSIRDLSKCTTAEEMRSLAAWLYPFSTLIMISRDRSTVDAVRKQAEALGACGWGPRMESVIKRLRYTPGRGFWFARRVTKGER